MFILTSIIDCLFPLMALLLLIIGIQRKAIYYIISSLWLSVIALIIHFQSSGSQIFGGYFDYLQASIYSVNLIVLFVALVCIFSHLAINSNFYLYLSSLFKAVICISILFLIINLWTNAYFIENRMPGTPIMQVALLEKSEYCSNKYVFYKVDKDGAVSYLCPNHFGIIPSIGKLAVSPEFIITQLSMPIKKEMLLLQQKKH